MSISRRESMFSGIALAGASIWSLFYKKPEQETKIEVTEQEQWDEIKQIVKDGVKDEMYVWFRKENGDWVEKVEGKHIRKDGEILSWVDEKDRIHPEAEMLVIRCTNKGIYRVLEWTSKGPVFPGCDAQTSYQRACAMPPDQHDNLPKESTMSVAAVNKLLGRDSDGNRYV